MERTDQPLPPTDLVIIVDDGPGQLHRIARVLGAAGVNIEGLAALTGNGRSVIHVLVNDRDSALCALNEAGLKARAAHQTLILNIPDRTGALEEVLQPLARAGINVQLAYIAVGSRSQTRAVLVVDDLDWALSILNAAGR